ncbi:MAG TPA: rhomboid family intramembrane serine protease, partial [Candidatus Dormibacteraeota bacterium]|nr:rhomboid family intramembrane serine protease [Candidatus Dormibacteraeota bacterium]
MQQPVVTYGLIAAFVGIFLLEIGLIRTPSQDVLCTNCVNGLLAFGALPNGELGGSVWWRLVSSAFVHDNSSPFHVGFNALAMLWIGRLVEQLYGRLVLLGTFLITAVVGGLLWIGISQTGLISLNGLAIGASGGIMGLVGLLLMLGRVQGRNVPVGIAFGIRRYAVTVILLTLAFGFLFPNVNNVAHVGGLAGGVLVGAIIPPMRRIGGRELSVPEKVVLAAAIGAAAVALLFAVAHMVDLLNSGARLV